MSDTIIVVMGIIGVIVALIFAGLADAMDMGSELEVTGGIAFLGAVSLLAVLIFGHIGSPNDGDMDTTPTTEYVQKKSHNETKLNDKVSAQAYDYKQSHPDAKFVKLDFSTGNKAKESYHERLLDKPDIESVDRVFYVDSDGRVASGDKYDYHEALKSDNLVYVFTTK